MALPFCGFAAGFGTAGVAVGAVVAVGLAVLLTDFATALLAPASSAPGAAWADVLLLVVFGDAAAGITAADVVAAVEALNTPGVAVAADSGALVAGAVCTLLELALDMLLLCGGSDVDPPVAVFGCSALVAAAAGAMLDPWSGLHFLPCPSSSQ